MAPKKLNPTMLGDPTSYKAETSDTEPTDADRPVKQKDKASKKTLKDVAEEKLKTNPSQLGDPVSLKAETSVSSPTGGDLNSEGGQGGRRKSKL